MLSSNFKRYEFFTFIAGLFFMAVAFMLGRYSICKIDIILLYVLIFALVGVIFFIYSEKYFNLTYQLKKNSKKEFAKKNERK